MRSVMAAKCLCMLALMFGAGTAFSSEARHVAPIRRYIDNHIKTWIHDPLIISTLKRQNALHARLSREEIEALDRAWRLELLNGRYQLIRGLLTNSASRFLEAKNEELQGPITEIFLMDAVGLNVGQSTVTSDYWQGDEEKFLRSFGAGAGAIFIGNPEKDDSTQMLQAQTSLTITDETGTPIGAITIGINLDFL